MKRDDLRQVRECGCGDEGCRWYDPVTDAELAELGYVKMDLDHVRHMISNHEIYDLEAYFDRRVEDDS